MVRGVLIFIICFDLMGCDPTFAPNFRNEYPEEINIIIYTKDGKKLSGFLFPCEAAAVGPLGSQRGVSGTLKVVVELKGKIIYEFSEEDLKKFLEKQNRGGSYAGWAIDPSGIHFIEEKACSLEKKKE